MKKDPPYGKKKTDVWEFSCKRAISVVKSFHSKDTVFPAVRGRKGNVTVIETKIYVGLNDSETRKQEHETSKYVSVLKKVCCSYHVPFSVSLSQGGYMHEDGQYIEELTLVISMIDVDKKIVDEIAGDLCSFFNQESVMITEDRVRAFFINQTI